MNDPFSHWIVSRHLLEALAGEVAPTSSPSGPPKSAATNPKGTYSSRLSLDRWLFARGVLFRLKSEPDGKGRSVYVLKECPFDAAHADPDSCIMQAPDGKLSAYCFHDGCRGRGWKAFKAKIGPPDADHYDPPLPPRIRSTNQRRGVLESSEPSNLSGSVQIDPLNIPVRESMRSITAVLLGARDCFRRAEQLVRITGVSISPVLSAAELSGLVNHHAEVLVAGKEGNEYKPLPSNYANTWLNHPGEMCRLPIISLFTLNPVFTLDWRLSPPGYDSGTGIYYAGDIVRPHSDTKHLDRLLRDFCLKTPGDRANYIGMLVTTILIPHFIGSKPAVVFNGNQPGLGKSILAQIIAILRDGRLTETASYNPNDEEFEKRIGSIVRRGSTTIIIDNAKTGGSRHPRIESACLERSITDPILSFRLLGYSKEIRAENSHIFCITANSAELGPDLVTRSVMVALYYEGDPKRRSFAMPDPEGYALEHRKELLGELLGLVERWKAAGSLLVEAPTRFNKKGWGGIIGGILQVAGISDFLANADTAAVEMDETRRDFALLVAAIAELDSVERTATDLAAIAASQGLLRAAIGDTSPRAAATRMGILASRFIGEPFVVANGLIAILRRSDARDGSLYSIEVQAR